ncbi:MAG TPA: hypothetical protein VJ915_05930 [Balneolaceae bacterium]|nr:hypothetical protein [Balneolaceae bacterium]
MPKTKTAEELKDALEKEKQYIEDRYTQVLDTLEYERDRIQNELRREFRTARRYVRANPEVGVGAAFAGGILAGVLLSAMIKK